MSKTLIAIPVYNAGKVLRRTLSSCVEQNPPADILVVNNCSTDDTAAIAAEYAEKYDFVTLINNDANLGRVGNWNKILDIFMGGDHEYLRFVFSGDTMHPECTTMVENAFEANPGISAVVWPYEVINLCGTSEVSRIMQESRRLDFDDLLAEGYYPSGILGGPCHTFSRKGIGTNRYVEQFLGAHVFHDQVVLNGGVFHLNEVLSTLYMDSRMSHEKQFDTAYLLEYYYSKAYGLELARNRIPEKQFNKMKQKIITESFVQHIPRMSTLHFLKSMGRFISIFCAKSWFDLKLNYHRLIKTIKGTRAPKHLRQPVYYHIKD